MKCTEPVWCAPTLEGVEGSVAEELAILVDLYRLLGHAVDWSQDSGKDFVQSRTHPEGSMENRTSWPRNCGKLQTLAKGTYATTCGKPNASARDLWKPMLA